MNIENSAQLPDDSNAPRLHSLDGIDRRQSLKAQCGQHMRPANSEPRSVAVTRSERPSDAPATVDALRMKMIDTLLMAYVGLRGHLHAPGMVRLGELSEQIAETLAETGTLDNWLPWHGGECPLPSSVEVEIAWSDGGRQTATAGDIPWAVPERAGLVDLGEALRFVMFYRVVRW